MRNKILLISVAVMLVIGLLVGCAPEPAPGLAPAPTSETAVATPSPEYEDTAPIALAQEGCTAFVATGNATVTGETIIARCKDMTWNSPILAVKIYHQGGTKYIAEKATSYFINDKGVIELRQARSPKYAPEIPGGKSRIYMCDEAAKRASTAKEAVDIVKAISDEYGYFDATGWPGGTGLLFADAKEAYLIEMRTDLNGVLGPIKNDVYAIGNYYDTPELKTFGSEGSGWLRAARARQLLEDFKGWISVPFMMEITRDLGKNEKYDGYGKYLSYDDWALCHHSYGVYTILGTVGHANSKHPDLLSTMWIAFGSPDSTPYIPFFIGINKIPPAYAEDGEAGPIFNKLMRLVEAYPEYADEVLQTWETFEKNEMQEVQGLEKEVAKLVEAGKTAKAEELLTDYTMEKADWVVKTAKKMIAKIERETPWY